MSQAGQGSAKRQKLRHVDIQALSPALDKEAPLVATFASGNAAAMTAQDLQYEVYETAEGVRPKHRMLICPRGKADLVGRIGDIAGPTPCWYALGVYDPQTQKLQLAPAQGSQLVRLEPRLHGFDYGPKEHGEEQQGLVDQSPAGKRAQAKRLVQMFGSTRRKRQLASREEGTVNPDKLLSADATERMLAGVNAAAHASGLTRDKVMQRTAAHRNVPAHNPQATEPEQAYVVMDMFPAGCLAALNIGMLLHASEKADLLKSLQDKRKVPEYILLRLPLLREASLDGAARKDKARLLALLAALLQLLAAKPHLRAESARGGLEAVARTVQIGKREVLEGLLDKFYNHSRDGSGTDVYAREAAQKELLLGHVLVVALAAEGWRMAPEQYDALRKELKMASADVVQRFRELGCVATAARGLEHLAGNKAYSIALLQDKATPPKTLAEYFPKPKLLAKAKAR